MLYDEYVKGNTIEYFMIAIMMECCNFFHKYENVKARQIYLQIFKRSDYDLDLN